MIATRTLASLAGIATLAILVVASPPPGGAAVQLGSDAPAAVAIITYEPSDTNIQVDEFQAADLRLIAEQEGISFRNAVARFGWQEEFSDAVAMIKAKHPDGFASSSMNEGDDFGGTITFKGPVPTDALELLNGVPVPVDLMGDAPLSETEVRQAVESVHYAVRAEALPHSVSTSFSAELGAVVTTVYGITEGDSAAMEAMYTAGNDAIRSVGKELDVQIRTAPAGDSGNDTIRGGAILTYAGTNTLQCTSGWPVRGTGGTTEGLITAEHCNGDFDYSGRDVLTYQRRLPYSKGDIQYNSSTEDVGYGFYYAVGEYRDIDGPVGNPSVDQFLCFFGRGSDDAKCDNVHNLTTCRDEYCNLVDMDDRRATGGDSGGPWFYGSRFYGVHSGWHRTLDFQTRDQWTPLNNTLDDLQVNVRVGPDG